MATIFWKTAAPFGTCRSRYKARRAEIVAARQREKRLLRKIGTLLGERAEITLSQKMRGAGGALPQCAHCGLPGTGHRTAWTFCLAAIQAMSAE